MLKKLKSLLSNDSYDSFIEITDIIKTENSIDIKFEMSEDMGEYIKENNYFIEYLKIDEDIRECPDSICVIPAVSNLLPIIWFFNAELIVKDLDKNFYKSLNKIKAGYKQMFPFINFKGKVTVKNTVDNSYEVSDSSIVLFSQGIDSLNTFISHADENLYLTTLHGSDIPLNKIEGLNQLSKSIDEFALQYDCENSFVKSNFRRCMNYPKLNARLPKNMKNSWWHQFQHGIGILSHAAIIAYLKKSRHIYMASTHSEYIADFLNVDYVPCASSPIIDNNFRFASCDVIHDGYEYKRIEKLQNIIEYSKENGAMNLRVCFATNDGDNCSACEKCSRSIFGLISEGEDPNDYGFNVDDKTLADIKENLDRLMDGHEKNGWQIGDYRPYYWINIQKNFRNNSDEIKDNEYINWILDYEFKQPIKEK